MNVNSVQYVVQLVHQGDTNITVNALKDVESQADKAGKAFKELSEKAEKTIKVAEGIHGLMEAFASYQQAVGRLNGMLTATGQFSAGYRAELLEQAESFSKVTLASSQTIIGVQSLLVSFGATREQMPGLTKAVLDLAAGLGISVNEAAAKFGVSVAETEKAMKSAGGTIDEHRLKMESLDAVSADVEKTFVGLSTAVKNVPGGELNDLDKSLEELKKTMGELALQTLEPVIKGVTLLANGLNDLLRNDSKLGEFVREFAKAGAIGIGVSRAVGMLSTAGGMAAEGSALAGAGSVAGPVGVIGWGAIQTGRAVYEGQKANTAINQAEDSLGNLESGNDDRLVKVLRFLKEVQSIGKISVEDAGALKTRLMAAAAQPVQTTSEPVHRDETALAKEIADAMGRLGAFSEDVRRAHETRSAAVLKQQDSSAEAFDQNQLYYQAGLGAADAAQQAQLQVTALEKVAETQQKTEQQQTLQLAQEYQKRAEVVDDFYDAEAQKANQTASHVVATEEKKNKDIEKQDKQHQAAKQQIDQMIQDIGVAAEKQFASGMSSAFVQIFQGTKNAGEAFKEFASSFLASIAQMILQTIILAEVQALMRGLGFGGAVTGMAGGGAVNARGGMHFNAAAMGIMLAAAGIQGVSQVNGPTYFPKFNTLAGEAGSEMLTVFARPQSSLIGGLPVITGDVGPDKLAIMSQETLSRMVRGGVHPMAGGGMSGGIGLSGIMPQASGKIIVELTPHPAYEQRVVKNSIEGARVQVATDINTDSAIRRAVKGAI